jgi:hypothetical protein
VVLPDGGPGTADRVLERSTLSRFHGDGGHFAGDGGRFGGRMIILESAYPVLSCVFGWAALGKMGRLREFRKQVADYRLLPGGLVGSAVVVVVSGEVAVAVLLVPPLSRVVGALLATLLLSVYLVAQVSAWVRGLEIDCGCFGGTDELSAIGPATVTRTALLLVLAVGADAAGGTPFRPMQLLVGPLLAGVVAVVPELTQRRYLR